MSARLLIIETSYSPGLVALADENRILAERRLDEARRHARALAPATAALLAEQGWRARDLEGVIVSRGPGSYTGLRVGIMSAKTLAYAVGCRLLAVDTFAAIAHQAPSSAQVVEVVADAQQNRLYAQRFHRTSAAEPWQVDLALAILPLDEWLARLSPGDWVTGPGLAGKQDRLPGTLSMAAEKDWQPRAESLLALGLERGRRGESDEVFRVEPLYLRPSAAEEQWKAKGRMQ